jgi:2-iminobutanoate/2-iminopropanoate deaminase
MRRLILLLFFGGMGSILQAQQQSPLFTMANPDALSKPTGYSHAVIIPMGETKMIILSGQVPLDKNGNLVGAGDFARQVEQVFLNIKNALSELGASMNDIVKTNYYVTDLKQVPTIRAIRNKFINVDQPPASTLVGVTGLFRDDIMIEVEVTAIVAAKQQGRH